MSTKIKFVLNRKNFADQLLRGDAVEALLLQKAEAGKPDGSRINVTSSRSGSRVVVRIVDSSYQAMRREAQEGHLSRAIGATGGDGKLWYTTKAGTRRRATQAEIDNWTRGRR